MQTYQCARQDCGCKVQLKIIYYQDGNTSTFQAHEIHSHTGPFNGRGIHPALRAKLDEQISNNTTAPLVLLDILRDANLIREPNVPEPTLAHVIPNIHYLNSEISHGYYEIKGSVCMHRFIVFFEIVAKHPHLEDAMVDIVARC